jgi:hypothetical protein
MILEQKECEQLSRFREHRNTAAETLSALQTISQVTDEERATIEFDELGTPLPSGMRRKELKRFPSPSNRNRVNVFFHPAFT